MNSLQLPSIRELIVDDFVLINRADYNEDDIIQNFSKDTYVFFLEEGKFRYLSDIIPPKKIIWKECKAVTSQTSLKDIVQLLSHQKILIVHEEKGQVLGYINLQSAINKLLSHNKFLISYIETVLRTLDSSVTVIDKDGSVLVWTEGAEKIFSIKKEEIIGNYIANFFDINMLEIMKTLKEGRSLYRHQHQPRSDLIVLINSNPVYLDGEIIGAVVSETDITSQVRLNQELFNVSTKFHDLEREVAKLSPSQNPFQSIKGSSTAIMKSINTAKKVGSVKTNILITGESGVGKELFAKAIHDLREDNNSPFVPINCGAIPSTLFESELFGYEKGAFSGADQKGKIGKIALANGGTLLLDEIGEMPLEMQVKMLRVLQEKKFFPIGGSKEVTVDFRIVSATNRDLLQMVKEGKFREDLYYRLNVVNLYIPPLRERKEDIIELTHYFLYEFTIRYNRPIHGISQEVMNQLVQHSWSGNIRELRNVIERLVVFATDGIIKVEDLPFYHSDSARLEETLDIHETKYDHIGLLSTELEKYERKIILDALKHDNNNKQACAKRLGITRATLYNKMKKLNIPM